MHRIGFIGAGKMATALIAGLVEAGYDPRLIYASCPTESHLAPLAQTYHIQTTCDNQEAAQAVDVVVLAVKPQHVESVLAELCAPISDRGLLVVSLMAGVNDSTLRQYFGEKPVRLVRAMPNTAVQVRQGITVLYGSEAVNQDDKEGCETLFKQVGRTVWIEDEQQMSAVTALSGSGPAYFFSLMEALQQAGVELGLAQPLAHQLAIQVARGSADMAIGTDQDLIALRQQVTSPGGGTARAMEVFETREFKSLILEAVSAAKKRYDEMT